MNLTSFGQALLSIRKEWVMGEGFLLIVVGGAYYLFTLISLNDGIGGVIRGVRLDIIGCLFLGGLTGLRSNVCA